MKNKIDLSDIKENDLDKTSSFTDLMTRKERKKRLKGYEEIEKEEIKDNFDDIEEMVIEKKRTTKDLTSDVEKAKEQLMDLYNNDDDLTNKEINDEINDKIKNELKDEKEDSLAKTQLLELTRQIKFNLEETKQENKKKKKNGISILNIIGEINLLCIGYYIYLLVFTSFQDNQQNYLINGSIIISLVLLFGLSIVTRKNISKFFNILNILVILSFIIFNAYTLIN